MDEKDMERIADTIYDLAELTGISAEEANRAICSAMGLLKFDPQREIALIRMNPSLSRFQKWRLTRRILLDAKRKEKRKRCEGGMTSA